MLNRLNFIKIIGIAGTVALSSCGGGGDVAGGLTDFSVSPAEFTWTALKGDEFCSNTGGLENIVTIVGGTPPYRVVSSVPDYAIVSKTEVTGKNPTFKVTTGRGCGEVTVLVLDYHSRSTAFTLKVEAGEALDATTTTDSTTTTTP
jgi:hypothetical protein